MFDAGRLSELQLIVALEWHERRNALVGGVLS
jgi:hypothetical protein